MFKLFIFTLLVFFSTEASAEYYLVYQRPTTSYINLNFSTKTHAHRYHTRHIHHRLRRIDSTVVVYRQTEVSRTCSGCTPESCYVPRRNIYIGAPTDCVTYDAVLSGSD